MATSFRLIISRRIRAEMIQQAQNERPHECCGILAGQRDDDRGLVVQRYPLVNAAASPVEFESEPRSMLAAHKAMRTAGLELLAIYHSHPTSPAIPSRVDLQRNNFGDTVVNLIISLRLEVPEIGAWWLGVSDFREADVEWID